MDWPESYGNAEHSRKSLKKTPRKIVKNTKKKIIAAQKAKRAAAARVARREERARAARIEERARRELFERYQRQRTSIFRPYIMPSLNPHDIPNYFDSYPENTRGLRTG